jgi:GNAT superfamily N-acetyltransferase
MASAATELLSIRSATEDDVALVLDFIQKLAEYEKLSHEVVATESTLRNYLFGPRPMAEVILAHWGGQPVGFALYFHNFSTFLARPGIYLEDLFVDPEHRGKGIGKALLVQLARIAAERDCGRLEWSVLDWNEPSIQFYRKLGAESKDAWTTYRLTGDALERLAAKGGHG